MSYIQLVNFSCHQHVQCEGVPVTRYWSTRKSDGYKILHTGCLTPLIGDLTKTNENSSPELKRNVLSIYPKAFFFLRLILP